MELLGGHGVCPLPLQLPQAQQPQKRHQHRRPPRGTLNAACGGCAATSPSRSNSRRRRTALESRGSSAYGRLFTADELTSLRPYAARGPAFVAVPQASASGPPSVCSCCVPRARTCVAFGVECLVNCEDDVAVFERGSGCVDGLLEGAEGMSPMMRGRSRWRSSCSIRSMILSGTRA